MNIAHRVAWNWPGRILVLAWAVFWGWFVLMVGGGEILHGTYQGVPYVATWAAALTGLTICVWRWPVLGGVLMLAAGLFAVVYFPSNGARLLLALPAGVIGVLAIAGAYAGRMPR